MISGLLLALPIAITIWIIYWLYSTLQGIVLDPVARLFQIDRAREGLPYWWERMVAPLVAIGIVLIFLYFLGHLVHTRLARALDWFMSRLPLVTFIYKAVRNVFLSLTDQGQGQRFKRVVLVEFPHPGMRALAFVTRTLRDIETDRTILCVCVLTGVVPPAGFTLFVPEEDVIDLDWSANQSLQTIVSGGISAPGAIPFTHRRGHPANATGPILDTQGHPIQAPQPASEAEASGLTTS
jgi:uncharacterized membrane protein